MENFIFQSPTKIIFGRGAEASVGEEVRKYSSRIMLHYGGGNIKKSGLYDRVINSLKKAGIGFVELSGAMPNPRLALVKRGIEICREEHIDFILAVGGGSAMDSAKAIAVGVPYEGDVWDLYAKKAEAGKALPVGVVLTIPASGSEVSPSSVITNENGQYKRGLTTQLIRPAFAILNPELSFTLPPFQTACGAADIIAHVMERYFTNVKNVDLTDRLCEATIKTVIANTPIILEEPGNYAARAEIMWAGTVAHNDLLGTGRIGDWASHAIEHEISGIYDVAHGAGLAAVIPAWMKYVYKHNVDRFVQFAVRVWNVDMDFDSPERIAVEGIKRLEMFFKSIGLHTTMKELGIGDERFDEMASKCKGADTGSTGNLAKLNKADVYNILTLAK